MTIVRNPIYRYHNCNLQSPRLLCEDLKTDTLEFNRWTASGITLQSGELDFANVFLISPTSLALSNAVGELTVYLKNEAENYVHIVMYIITKTGGILNTPLNYQTVGNLNTVTTSTPNNSTVRIAIDPGAVCKWIWRAI